MSTQPLKSDQPSAGPQGRVLFDKMHGTGNDFIVVDLIRPGQYALQTDEDFAEHAVALCHRQFGIGCDQMLILRPPDNFLEAAFKMVILNSDGSFAKMCGNGARCAAKFFADRHLDPAARQDLETFAMETASGIVQCKHYRSHPQNSASTSWVGVNLNQPAITDLQTTIAASNASNGADREFSATLVSMGNPHCVIFDFPEALADFPLTTWGPIVEHHSRFSDRTNVEFVSVEDPNTLRMRVWERGAGITLSCGSGACAVAAAAIARSKVASKVVTIHVPGGVLRVDWSVPDQLWLEGPATFVFQGVIEVQAKSK